MIIVFSRKFVRMLSIFALIVLSPLVFAANGILFSQVGSTLYPRTAAEFAAAVTPTNHQYQAGNVLRYNATGDGVTDDTVALQNAMSVSAGHSIIFPDGHRTAVPFHMYRGAETPSFRPFRRAASRRSGWPRPRPAQLSLFHAGTARRSCAAAAPDVRQGRRTANASTHAMSGSPVALGQQSDRPTIPSPLTARNQSSGVKTGSLRRKCEKSSNPSSKGVSTEPQ